MYLDLCNHAKSVPTSPYEPAESPPCQRSSSPQHTFGPIHNHSIKSEHSRPTINEEACWPHSPALPQELTKALFRPSDGCGGRQGREGDRPPAACPLPGRPSSSRPRRRPESPLQPRGKDGWGGQWGRRCRPHSPTPPAEPGRLLAAPVPMLGSRQRPRESHGGHRRSRGRGSGEEPWPTVYRAELCASSRARRLRPTASISLHGAVRRGRCRPPRVCEVLRLCACLVRRPPRDGSGDRGPPGGGGGRPRFLGNGGGRPRGRSGEEGGEWSREGAGRGGLPARAGGEQVRRRR